MMVFIVVESFFSFFGFMMSFFFMLFENLVLDIEWYFLLFGFFYFVSKIIVGLYLGVGKSRFGWFFIVGFGFFLYGLI